MRMISAIWVRCRPASFASVVSRIRMLGAGHVWARWRTQLLHASSLTGRNNTTHWGHLARWHTVSVLSPLWISWRRRVCVHRSLRTKVRSLPVVKWHRWTARSTRIKVFTRAGGHRIALPVCSAHPHARTRRYRRRAIFMQTEMIQWRRSAREVASADRGLPPRCRLGIKTQRHRPIGKISTIFHHRAWIHTLWAAA